MRPESQFRWNRITNGVRSGDFSFLPSATIFLLALLILMPSGFSLLAQTPEKTAPGKSPDQRTEAQNGTISPGGSGTNGEANRPENKQELKGLKFTAIPLPSYSSDLGTGMGLRVYGTDYEEGYEPYRYQFYGQFYRTTKGYEYHVAALDMMRFLGTPLRAKFRGGYERTLNAQYYGTGNYHDMQRQKQIQNGEIPINENLPATPDLVQLNDELTLNRNFLTDPTGTNGSVLNKNRRQLRESQNKYYNYDRIRPFLEGSTEDFIGRTNFKWFAGFRAQSYRILSYAGDREGGEAEPDNKTLIDLQRPTGYDATVKARYVNTMRAAVAYDSRPRLREKNPNAGIFTDLHFEGSGKGTGSNYSFQKVTLTWRQYQELLPSLFHPSNRELVFAYRVLGQQTFGDPPFFEEGYIINMNPGEFNEGLGSDRGLRGYAANQFVDRVMGMANMELRFTTYRIHALGGVDVVLVGYYDVGRVAPTREEMVLHGLHQAAGGGVRLVWQKNTIVNISYGRSYYGSNANFSFDHPF